MAEGSTTTGSKINFTEGESSLLLLAIMQNLKSEIQFDADAIATQLGYKNGAIVKTRWNQIKNKKLKAATASPGSGIKKRTSTTKSTAKKGKGGEDGIGGSDDDELATPTKTPTKRGCKAKAEETMEEEPNIKKEEMEDAVETTEKED